MLSLFVLSFKFFILLVQLSYLFYFNCVLIYRVQFSTIHVLYYLYYLKACEPVYLVPFWRFQDVNNATYTYVLGIYSFLKSYLTRFRFYSSYSILTLLLVCLLNFRLPIPFFTKQIFGRQARQILNTLAKYFDCCGKRRGGLRRVTLIMTNDRLRFYSIKMFIRIRPWDWRIYTNWICIVRHVGTSPYMSGTAEILFV